MNRKLSTWLVGALVLLASSVLSPVALPTTAGAVVGRPVTPVSVAGVGRRSARRHGVHRVAPVAGAVVVGAAATATALAIGTTVSNQPTGCNEQMVNGLTYLHCDGTWFQPQVQGGSVAYVVVAPPN